MHGGDGVSCKHCPKGSYDYDEYEVMELYADNTGLHIVCKHCGRKGIVYVTLEDEINWEVTA
jgi:ribosomal protein L37E